MGNICVTQKLSPEEREAAEKSRMIERMIEEERRAQLAESKLLLLGAGESGKSTIAKQMKMIYLSGFNDQERQAYKALIYVNIISATQVLITQAAKRSLSFEPYDAEAQEIEAISIIAPIDYTRELAEKVQHIWQHATVQELLKVSNEFMLADSAPYFLGNCIQYSQPTYTVTDDDILRVRSKTTGIIETAFTIKRKKIRMVDVGGQRNERKKWIHCFQDVTCILFCAALNDYDLVLEEDESVNRMHESLALFEETITSFWFERTNIILFLNKIDLFEQKIAHKDLKCCFPNYEDGCNAENARKYILSKFVEKNRGNEMRRIYSHFTCATSTQNIVVVFKAIQAIILMDQFEDMIV